jgi:ATP diphosphatase
VQDFSTIAPYTVEEAYEVSDAIRGGPDFPALLDELGDLLFQVVYHAQMAQEAGQFGFASIADAISAKMVRRRRPLNVRRELKPAPWPECLLASLP